MYPLRMTRLLLVVLLLTISFTQVFAQARSVTGKVTDDKGLPVESATVAIKGTKQSALTNEKGDFTINVAGNDAVLVISYTGMAKQEIKVGEQTSVNVSMVRNNASMEDVVVIGYGSQKTREVTGAVATIDLKKVADIPVATISEAIRGQIPGLNVSGGSTRPGTMPNVTIRQQFGFSKTGVNSTPLIIIDDIIQVDQNGRASLERFNQLDMSEVESITVLKDASAAIYGSRASQGAIVIKTKRGKNGIPRLTYTGKYETMDAVSHGKVMNAQEYGIFNNRFNRASGNTDSSYYFSPKELAGMGNINYDWLMNDWKRANTMQHSLDVSGGTERATYFTGASYYTQGANLGQQDFDRWTFRAGTDIKLVNNLRLGATIAANNTTLEKSFSKINVNDAYATGGEQRDYSVLLHMPKYIPWEYTVGGVKRFISPVLSTRATGNATGNNSLSNWNYYALQNNGSKTYTKTYGYNANFTLQYDVPWVKGLSFKGTYGINSTASDNEQVQIPFELTQGDNIIKAGYHLFTDSSVFKAPQLNKSGSRVAYINSTSSNTQFNGFINYEGIFGEHKISAVAAVESAEYGNKSQTLLYDNPIPGAYNGTSVSAGTFNSGNTITSRSEGGMLSYLGRLSYSFKGRYLAQFILRSDASVNFAPENRWGTFPGISLGWIVSDEEWFKNSVRGIDNLKLRGSLGKTGGDNIAAWRWMQLYKAETDKGMGFGTNGGNYVTGLTPEVTPNRGIRWDQTINRNIGIDLSVLRNRLSLTIDGYYNSGTDLLTDMSAAQNVPLSIGGAFAEQNYSSVNSWGTEISATWRNNGKNFNYSIGMNFGIGDNKVTKYVEQAFNYPNIVTTRNETGQSTIRPAWGYRTWKQTSTGDGILRTDDDINRYWDYLTNNAANSGVAGAAPKFGTITTKSGIKKGMLAFEDVAGALDVKNRSVAGPDGTITKDQDYVRYNKQNRSYTLVTNLSASWKSLSFLGQIVTSWGGINTIDIVKQATGSTSAMFAHPVYLNDMYDSTDNPNGKYPNLFYYDNFEGSNSDFFHISAFRCYVRSLSVGYSLPSEMVKKAHVESVRIFLAGNNLWDFSNPYPNKYRNMYDSPTSEYPTLRTWALGINLGF